MSTDITARVAPPAYLRRFWAKAYPYRQRGPERIHLLEHHLADVGACLEALLAQPTIRRRLARAGGLHDLDAATIARLCVFAALHDIGKVNAGFQTQVWLPGDVQGGRPIQRTGHTLDIAPVLTGIDSEATEWFFAALGWSELTAWDDRDGETVSDLLVATLSHHGLPLQLEGARQANPAIWRSFGGLEPARCVRRIGGLVRRWFPAALDACAPPLPSAPAFQHMFLGLCTLADWLGSNEAYFPFLDEPDDGYIGSTRQNARRAVSEIGLDLGQQRRTFRTRGALPDFASLFGMDGAASPNAVQRHAAMATPLGEQLTIVESETGSGKTEAALWRFARMYEAELVDGIYFALPTRAAATQMYERVQRFTGTLFPEGRHAPAVVLAVPGYMRDGDATGRLLQNYEVWWDDHPDDATRGRRWAAEHAKRYLAAQIAVGTVDQAMMAALKVTHAHIRAACLSRNLLVIDEVHASDTYMRGILRALLDAHLEAGGYALLMSATLGSVARWQWLSAGLGAAASDIPLDAAIQSPYPAVSTRSGDGERVTAVGENGREKTVRVDGTPLMEQPGRVAERALEAARAGAKVLVIRNTVDYAIRTQQAIEHAAATRERSLLFACNDVPTLHHGRFAAGDRRLLDRAVETLLGKERAGGGVIVVGTQTLEQSLDIDADLLITDLCPVDVLLQRIGRLHRHRRDDRPATHLTPNCVVLLPGEGDLTPLLVRGSNGLGRFVYEDLRILEATRRLIDRDSEWIIPGMNRELVERATHPAALEAITEELGGAWRDHANRVTGAGLAEGLSAHSVVIRRDKSFCGDNRDVLFGSLEERIRTRLGDAGVKMDLVPPPPSPFGQGVIEHILVPRRWLADGVEEGPTAPAVRDDGFAFRVGERSFRYDRVGLRREAEPAAG